MANVMTFDRLNASSSNSSQGKDRLQLTQEYLGQCPSSGVNARWIYWEYQEQGRMCALHAVNSLLQGPVYTETQLADLALHFDREERRLLSNSATETTAPKHMTLDALAAAHSQSENVSDDGFFSFPVIEEALKRYRVNCEPYTTSWRRVRTSDIVSKDGLLIHYKEHWASLRQIDSRWFSLDSMQLGPFPLTTPQLMLVLEQLAEREGVVMFAISNIPPREKEKCSKPNQVYLSVDQIDAMAKAKANAGIVPSLLEMIESSGNPASSSFARTATSPVTHANAEDSFAVQDEDAEMQLALQQSIDELKASLPLPPEEPSESDPQCIRIQVRHLDGSVASRRFSMEDPIAVMFHWVEKDPTFQHGYDVCTLISSYPTQKFFRYSPFSDVYYISDASPQEEEISKKTFGDFFTTKSESLYLQCVYSQR